MIENASSFVYSSCVSGKGSEIKYRSASPSFFTTHADSSDSDLYGNPDESKKPGGP